MAQRRRNRPSLDLPSAQQLADEVGPLIGREAGGGPMAPGVTHAPRLRGVEEQPGEVASAPQGVGVLGAEDLREAYWMVPT